jgi:hypothetical protein
MSTTRKLHNYLGATPDIAVRAFVHNNEKYIAVAGTGDAEGDGQHVGCFVYEALEVEAFLESRETGTYQDFCDALSPVEDVEVARTCRAETNWAANAAGVCEPIAV